MLVQEVMARDVQAIAPDAAIDEAARLMADLDVGALPVCAEGEGLVGIITDRDILIRVVAQGRDARQVHVGEVMSSQLFTADPAEGAEEVERAMEERQIRRMPVIDGTGDMVGLVTLSALRESRCRPAAADAGRSR